MMTARQFGSLIVIALSLAGLAILATLASGQELPSDVGLKLTAPAECEIGELVRLDARESDVSSFRWQIDPPTPDFEIVDSGRRAFFSARAPGAYVVFIAAAKQDKAYSLIHRLVVQGVESQTVLVAKTAQWLRQVPVFAERNAQLAAMAAVFRRLATSETELSKMLEATALANTAVIGDHLDQWSEFLDKLGQELDTLVEQKQLETREQYRQRWLEIADALERAAR